MLAAASLASGVLELSGHEAGGVAKTYDAAILVDGEKGGFAQSLASVLPCLLSPCCLLARGAKPRSM